MPRKTITHQVIDGRVHIEGPASTMAEFVRLSLRGQSAQRIARDWTVPEVAVAAVQDAHGWPSPRRLKESAEQLDQLGELTVATDAAPRSPLPDDPGPTFALGSDTPPDIAATVSDIADLLTRASKARKTATLNAATRLKAQADALRRRLDEEETAEREAKARKDAKAKQDRERARKAKEIRDQIAALKAELKQVNGASTTTTSRLTQGEHPCPEPGCGRTFTTSQGLSLHRRRAHATQTTERQDQP